MSDKQLQAEIGARMKQAAAAVGLGAYEVAEALGVRPPTVYRWWTGESRTDRATMARYAQLVALPQVWLEAGDGVFDYVATMLRRWVDAASSGMQGDKAIEAVDARLLDTDPGLAEAVRREAPGMLQIIEEMGGGDWESLSEAVRTAIVRRLVEALDAQRRSPGQGGSPGQRKRP